MKRFFFLALFAVATQCVFAQGYSQSVGIRAGWSSGLEYRFYTDDSNSYKFLLSGRNRGLQAHALKEFHQYDLFSFSNQLVFVYGFGIHVGFERWNEWYAAPGRSWYDTRSSLIVGGDGLAGLEYIFDELPISAGIEVKPFFDILGKKPFRINVFDFAFTVKYLF